MKHRKLRRIALASSLSGVAMAAALVLGVATAGTASAGITIPAFPGQAGAPVAGFGLYPEWLPTSSGADPISNIDHSEGSDTTLYVMQALSTLYSQAGIAPFSCTIIKTANSDCELPSVATPNPNNTQSDETDNFSGTEELQGINDVGSGNGQAELCGGTPAAPAGPLGVDYSRSSKPNSSGTCPKGVGLGFAKDAVISLDFQHMNPSLYGTPTGYETQTDPTCNNSSATPPTSFGAGFYPSWTASNGTLVCTQFPTNGIVGNVASGWEPGNSVTCTPDANQATQGSGNNCSGSPFTDISNAGIAGGSGATSPAYRLFCQNGPAGTAGSAVANESQITDWGQLTNLNANAPGNGGVAQPVGDGAPIGIPVNIIGINNGSGTVATFYAFAQSGIGNGTNCNGGVGTVSSSSVDANATSGPDPDASQGPAGGTGNNEIALENDANQIGDFAAANFATSTNCDAADQAVSIATSLYSESYGVYNSNLNSEVASIESPTGCTNDPVPAGDPSTFTETIMTANGKSVVGNFGTNKYAMSRTLFNIYRTDTVRASVGGFLNWLCDSNSSFTKGTDHILGGNFDTDVTDIIQNQFDFLRLSDATNELAINTQTPADNVPLGAPNGSCDANLPIAASGITAGSPTITLTGPVPPSVQVGWSVSVPPLSSVSVAGLSVASISGSTITLNGNVATGTSGGPTPTNLYFPGQAPVLQVANLGS